MRLSAFRRRERYGCRSSFGARHRWWAEIAPCRASTSCCRLDADNDIPTPVIDRQCIRAKVHRMRVAIFSAGLFLASCSEAPQGPYAVLGPTCECANGGLCILIEPTPELKVVSNESCTKQGWLHPQVHCSFDFRTFDPDDKQQLHPLEFKRAYSIIRTSHKGEQCVEESSLPPL